MYATPIGRLGVGFCFVIHACAHAKPDWSKHIGTLPGVVGSSGKQVNSPEPLRTVRICPLLSNVITVALGAIASGAAEVALVIRAASPADTLIGLAGVTCALSTQAPSEKSRTESAGSTVDFNIGLRSRRITSSRLAAGKGGVWVSQRWRL